MEETVEDLEKLQHPHIIKYYGHLETEREFYLMFEYLPGMDLSRYAQQQDGKKLHYSKAVKWVRQVTMALQYLHSQGKIHRDVRPMKVYLTSLNWEEADAKLGDVENLGIQHQGSLPYKAPDMIGTAYTEKVDVWSLGCMTFQLLTGQLPFNTDSPDKLRAGPVFPTDVDPKAQEFIRSCLTFSPEARPTCEQLLNSPFLSALYFSSCPKPNPNPLFISGSIPEQAIQVMFVESFNAVVRKGLEHAKFFALLSPLDGKTCADNALRQALMSLELFHSYAQEHPEFKETFDQLTAKTTALQQFSEECRKRI
jgi:serine/threonine protein kinase